jgi:hypothetical protein
MKTAVDGTQVFFCQGMTVQMTSTWLGIVED